MKTFTSFLLFCFVLSLSLTAQNKQEKNTPPEKSSYDYWSKKMSDPGVNFHQLKSEFNQFWSGKQPQKGSGYKPVARWFDAQRPFVEPDGSIRSPQVDLENAQLFMTTNAAQSISGQWTSVGPDMPVIDADNLQGPVAGIGRVSGIAFHPTDQNIVYVGAPLGGLWVSYNQGLQWENLNTDNITSLGVSAIAVNPENTDEILIGTGDRDGHKTRGIGLYKSIDAGQTWAPMPLGSYTDHYVAKIIYHPVHSDTIVVAGSYGIYKTVNSGLTWSRKLTAFLKDMELCPGSNDTLYCVDENKCYRSVDFGNTWEVVLETVSHRMAISVTADNPDLIAIITILDSKPFKLYKSNDRGENWNFNNLNGFSEGEGQGGYNLDIVIDPLNENIMFGGMINIYKSTDGGMNWVNQEPVYADDQHIFEFHPVTHRLFIGNDSGIWYTDNGTLYSYSSNGLRITTSYRMDVAAQNPQRIIIGNQDAATFVTDGVLWYRSLSGDGMTCKFDPTDQNYVYGTSQSGPVARSTNGGTVYPGFTLIAGNTVNGINETALFQTPFMIDYFDPNKMYYGANDVWRSNNIKAPNADDVVFEEVSHNLAGVNPDTRIEFIEQSRDNGSILYVAYENGRMFRSDNIDSSDPTWTELPNPNNNGGVRFESHPTDENIVYLVRGHNVYKSINKGASWIDITGNLPYLGMMSIAYMNGSQDGLYVGTTAGVYYKDNNMDNWVLFKTGIPLTQVRDLVINYSTTPAQIFAATFGRGVWKTQVMTSYKPDLLAGAGTLTANGSVITATNTISASESMVTVENVTAKYYLSVNQNITSTDYLISTVEIPELTSGSSVQCGITNLDVAAISPEIPEGSYYLGLLIDPENEVTETNETNNVWRSTSLITIPANPVPPINVQATDGSFSQKVVITWQHPTGETLYFAVFRSTLNSTFFSQQISPATWISGTSFEDITVPNGVNHYYFVKASRYPSGSHASEFSSGDAGHRKIAPPSQVFASDGQFSDKIEIKWPSCPGASHYRVYRNTSPIVADNMYISGLTWINDTLFNDNTAILGTTYYYWVRAAKSELGSSASDYSVANTGWIGFITAPVAVATDGTSTSNISVSWNTVAGANSYQVFRNTVNDPETAVSISSWQTTTTYTDNSVSAGMLYYYWIKASQDATGTVTTGLGTGDSGFRNLLAPTGVLASDGSSTEYVNIKWVSSASATHYRVYRNTLGFPCNCPVSNWQADRNFNDYSAVPGVLYYYWIKASSDSNVIISAYSSENSGYRKIAAPVVIASTGIYDNKVSLSWNSVSGASYYKVSRSTVEDPAVVTVLANWSNTLNGSFEDFTAIVGQSYNYYVAGATNSSGLRAGSNGQDIGYAGACGNMIDSPSYRSVYLHGSTIDISQRIVNEGPFALSNPGQIALALENANPDGTPEAMLGYVNIPALAVGAYYDYNFSVDLSTIPGFTLNLGEYHIAVYMSWDNSNCDSDPDDDYLIWDTPSFEYTDAMYGTYSIGEGTGDFNDISKAVEALQTRGISDDVVFNIKPGQYLEQLTLTSIDGSSPSKTITFQSESITQKATIIAQPGPSNNFTIRFNQASNYVFKNLILTTTGFSDFESTYGKVIVIGNDCHNLEFSDNQIIGFSDPSHLNDDNDVIYANYIQASGIVIDGNQITNGVHGIYLTGSSSASIQNCVIMRNTITGFNDAGIWLNYHNHPVILNNTISNTNVINFYVTGMNLSNISNGFDVSNNNIQLQSVDQNLFGMTIDNLNMDGSQPGILSNNMMAMVSGSSFLYGIQFYQIHKTRILNNSIHLKADYSEFSCGFMFSCADLTFDFDNSLVNNIINNQAGGYCITYHDNPINHHLLSESDYNDFISSGPDLFLYRMVPMQGIDDWNAETGFDVHSISADPGFVTDLDLHSTSEAVNEAGIPRPEVTTDIDGENRSTVRPDIGADEFTPPSQFKTLNLTLFLEGLISGTNVMRQAQDVSGPRYNPGIADEIRIELRQSGNYNNLVYSAYVFLSTNGQTSINIPGNLNGSYYITVRHRNSIETTTPSPVSFSNTVINYNFSSAAAQAYGSNQKALYGAYVIYGGDVNQDGIVDGSDMAAIDNASTAVLHGYVPEDVNGDSIVDGTDMAIIDNNSTAAVMSLHP